MAGLPLLLPPATSDRGLALQRKPPIGAVLHFRPQSLSRPVGLRQLLGDDPSSLRNHVDRTHSAVSKAYASRSYRVATSARSRYCPTCRERRR